MRGSIIPVAILEGMVMATKGVKKVTIPAIPLLATPMAKAARHMTAIAAGLSSMGGILQGKAAEGEAE
jgi:hypothetical protein